jgi:hypothetical protein
METTLHLSAVAAPRWTWTDPVPLIIFTAAALFLRGSVPPWALMWLVAIALFAGFKWWTWRRAIRAGVRTNAARSLAYLFLWPGMGTRKFLALPSPRVTCCPGSRGAIPREQEARICPRRAEWLWAAAKTILGATLLWAIARLAGHGLLAGWIGMVGFIFMLHFGLFALLSLFWQSRDIDAPPLMNCPIVAHSLHNFWGRRWNAGFHDIVSGLFFLPIARRCGATAAAVLTFVISGLLHELVITVPAGGGYGLPTLYFTLQGAALMLERSRIGTACGLTRGWRGHAFAWVVVTLPIFALFPPIFVLRVMVPFLQILQALP